MQANYDSCWSLRQFRKLNELITASINALNCIHLHEKEDSLTYAFYRNECAVVLVPWFSYACNRQKTMTDWYSRSWVCTLCHWWSQLSSAISNTIIAAAGGSIPFSTTDISLRHRVQTNPWAQPASKSMVTVDFPPTEQNGLNLI
jgi:hypothetical protein